jgi:hypothetical protein
MNQTFLDRKFRIWEFQVSHSRLLIRSPKSSLHPMNVDLMFFAVRYVNIPTFLNGIEIVDVVPDEVSNISAMIGRTVQTSDVFVFLSEGQRFVVVSGAMKISENEMDIFETEFKDFRLNRDPV